MASRAGWRQIVQVLGIAAPAGAIGRRGALPSAVPPHGCADLTTSGAVTPSLTESEEEAITLHTTTECVDANSIEAQDQIGVDHLLKRLRRSIPAWNKSAGLPVQCLAGHLQPRAVMDIADDIPQPETSLGPGVGEVAQRLPETAQDLLELGERTDAKDVVVWNGRNAEDYAPKGTKHDAAPRALGWSGVREVRHHSQGQRESSGRESCCIQPYMTRLYTSEQCCASGPARGMPGRLAGRARRLPLPAPAMRRQVPLRSGEGGCRKRSGLTLSAGCTPILDLVVATGRSRQIFAAAVMPTAASLLRRPTETSGREARYSAYEAMHSGTTEAPAAREFTRSQWSTGYRPLCAETRPFWTQ